MEAVELLRAGWSQADVARKFDATTETVCQRRKKWKTQPKRSFAWCASSGAAIGTVGCSSSKVDEATGLGSYGV